MMPRLLLLILTALWWGTTASAGECPEKKVTFPAGEVFTGAPDSPFPDSRRRGPFALEGFRIDQTEVSVGRFVAYAQTKQWGKTIQDLVADAQSYPCRPARGVTWEMAQGFCEAQGGALPSEVQWEYAARIESLGQGSPRWPAKGGPLPLTPEQVLARTDAPLSHTEESEVEAINLDALLEGENLEENLEKLLEDTESGIETSVLADFIQPNLVDVQNAYQGPNQLHGMIGNVWEWTQDWYSPIIKLQGTSKADGYWKVVRGGSFQNASVDNPNEQATLLNPTIRNPVKPTAEVPHVGFRCVYPLTRSAP